MKRELIRKCQQRSYKKCLKFVVLFSYTASSSKNILELHLILSCGISENNDSAEIYSEYEN